MGPLLSCFDLLCCLHPAHQQSEPSCRIPGARLSPVSVQDPASASGATATPWRSVHRTVRSTRVPGASHADFRSAREHTHTARQGNGVRRRNDGPYLSEISEEETVGCGGQTGPRETSVCGSEGCGGPCWTRKGVTREKLRAVEHAHKTSARHSRNFSFGFAVHILEIFLNLSD